MKEKKRQSETVKKGRENSVIKREGGKNEVKKDKIEGWEEGREERTNMKPKGGKTEKITKTG